MLEKLFQNIVNNYVSQEKYMEFRNIYYRTIIKALHIKADFLLTGK